MIEVANAASADAGDHGGSASVSDQPDPSRKIPIKLFIEEPDGLLQPEGVQEQIMEIPD